MYMKHLFSACLLACLSCGAVAQTSSKAVLPYQDTQLSPEQRAEDLLKRLTLEEKALLMQDNSQAIPRLQIKQYNWWNEALHGVARAGLATVFPQSIGMAASFRSACHVATRSLYRCVRRSTRQEPTVQ